MSENSDVIIIFPIYDKFGAIRNPDFGRIVGKIRWFFAKKMLMSANLGEPRY